MTTKQKIDLASAFPLLPGDFVREFAKRGRIVHLADGEYAQIKGERPDAFFGVVQGRLRMRNIFPSGREVFWGHLEQGACFGLHSLIDDGARIHDVISVRKSTLLKMTGTELRALLDERPDFCMPLIRPILKWMRGIMIQLEDLAALPLECRLARYMLWVSRRELTEEHITGGSGVLLTQEDLANAVGASRKSISVLLGRWEDQGWVRRRYGRVEILHSSMLHDIVNSFEQK